MEIIDAAFSNKNILITGGLGFLGSHLIKRLLSYNANIFVLNKDLTTWRLKDEMNKFTLFHADITDESQVNDCVNIAKPQYVFHMAAYGVNSSNKDYVTAANVNIMGALTLLNCLRNVACEKFINVGSSAEYGNKDEIITEDMMLEPVSIYGSTKASATIISHQVAKESGINIVTLRPFNIFGEGEERHKFFCDVIVTLLEGRDVDLTLCEQYRDYCYVGNIIDAFLLSAQDSRLENEVFNLGGGTSHQLRYYVDLIFKYMDTERKPNYGALPYRQNEIWNPRPGIYKIKEKLGWEPKVSLEEGLKRTVEWFKTNKDYYL